MKKSKSVPATLIVSIAAAIVTTGCGCNATQVRRCVDSTGRVLPDSACTGPMPSGNYTYSTGGGYGGSSYYSRPHWIYGGSYGSGRVSGGSLTPSGGADVVDGSGHTISRGGFGGGGGGGS